MSGTELLFVAVPALCLLVTAALEMASRSTSRFELHLWAQRARQEVNGGNGDDDIDVALTAVRLARQLSLVALVVVVAAEAGARLGPEAGFSERVLRSAGLSFLVYIVVDKVAAFSVVATLGPMRVLNLGRPLIVVLRLLFGRLARLMHRFQRDTRARDEPEDMTPEEGDLDAFLDLAEKEGLVSEEDEALLRGIADFGEAVVDEVMTPRVDIVSVAESATLRELIGLVAEHRVSRVPVIRENIDQVSGIVNIRELVAALENSSPDASVREIVRPALFVPESKQVSDLLREFQRRREQLAIVVDEYGGTAGLVTVEDLLEEIVGEIQDEHEDEEFSVVRVDEGVVVATGKAEIEELEELLDTHIDDDEFETIGGMTFLHLGYVPKPGEVFERDGLQVEILEADERRVQKVRITKIQPAGE